MQVLDDLGALHGGLALNSKRTLPLFFGVGYLTITVGLLCSFLIVIVFSHNNIDLCLMGSLLLAEHQRLRQHYRILTRLFFLVHDLNIADMVL